MLIANRLAAGLPLTRTIQTVVRRLAMSNLSIYFCGPSRLSCRRFSSCILVGHSSLFRVDMISRPSSHTTHVGHRSRAVGGLISRHSTYSVLAGLNLSGTSTHDLLAGLSDVLNDAGGPGPSSSPFTFLSSWPFSFGVGRALGGTTVQ